LEIFPIVSSSDGNCTYISAGSTSILIDCGIGIRQLRKALGRDRLQELEAVFVTHEHHDHIKGLDALARSCNIPVFINQLSYRAKVHQLMSIDFHQLDKGVETCIGALTLTPFQVSHDTINTFGFTIAEKNGPRLCYFTDAGSINRRHKALMKRADILFIECNYNEDMLVAFPDYPNHLKMRIRETHLSNRQALDALEEIGLDSFLKIIPAHLSPRTNSPDQLTRELRERFPDDLDKFAIAPLAKPLAAKPQVVLSETLTASMVA
jgi:phosphoribosyl 1,2-cyclic phosphodiesterase